MKNMENHELSNVSKPFQKMYVLSTFFSAT